MPENTTTPILGAPFDSGVRQQIDIRKQYRSSANKSNEVLAEQFGKTSWCRVSSGVIIDGDRDIAKNNILQGGVLAKTDTGFKQRQGFDVFDPSNSSYEYTEGLGFRPMPGIIDLEIISQNTQGTIRKTDIGFRVNDLEQLEIMERLYMRPGMSILVEYGHSIYHDNSGNVVTNIPTVGKFFDDTTNSPEEITIELEKLREESDYNYDAIFGLVMNFQYAYNMDGGYDCTMYVISKGTLLESLTQFVQGDASKAVNTDSDSTVSINTNALITKKSERSTSDNSSPTSAILSKMYEIAGSQDNTLDLLQEEYSTFGFEEEDVPYYLHNVNSKSKHKKMVYIRMSTFMKILDRTVNLLVTDSEPFVKLSTNRLVNSTFATYDGHFSSNPTVCLLLKPPKDKTLWFGAGAPGIPSFGGEGNQIKDIMLNIQFLLSILDELKTNNKKDSTLYDYIDSVLKEVSIAMGGYNELDLHYVEEDNTFYTVDRRVTPVEGQIFQNVIPCLGQESLVTNLQVTSKITNAITTMMAIGAQSQGQDLDGYSGLVLSFNKGLTDRYKPELKRPTTEDNKPEQPEADLEASLDSIRKVVRDFVVNRQLDISNFENLKSVHAKIVESDFTKGTEPISGTLPFECSFTMDGIGGIKIGQAFKLQPGILPEYIQRTAGFIVKSLGHSLKDNRWTTDISAYMMLTSPDPSKSVKNFTEADFSPQDKEKIQQFNGKDA